MSRPGRISWRASAVHVLLCSLVVAAATGADPSLQLYLDFEHYEPNWQHRSWVLHDNSPNGFDVETHNMGGLFALVPGKFGLAIQSSTVNSGSLHTGKSAIYAHGEGLTVSAWARATGDGWHRLISVHGGDHNSPVAAAVLSRSTDAQGDGRIHLGWDARQDDGETWAFHCQASREGANEWTHCAYVYDPDTAAALIYLNGEEVGRTDADGEPIADWGAPGPTSTIEISLHQDDRENPLLLDELRLHSRALSVDEIGELMQNPLDASAQGKAAISWGALKER